MAEFVAVARLSELSDPGRMVVELDDRLVVLVRVGSDVFAIDDVCTHDGGPLDEGEISDQTIACPRHGAKFDLRSGKALTMPATKPTKVYAVKIEDGEILVSIS